MVDNNLRSVADTAEPHPTGPEDPGTPLEKPSDTGDGAQAGANETPGQIPSDGAGPDA